MVNKSGDEFVGEVKCVGGSAEMWNIGKIYLNEPMQFK